MSATTCLAIHFGTSSPIAAYRKEMAGDVAELVADGMDPQAAWLQVATAKIAELKTERARIEKVVADAYDKARGVEKKPAADQPAPVATHKDPGEPAEPVTPAVVAEAIKTGVKATDRKPSEMKAELLAKIDAAMPNAKGADDQDVQRYEERGRAKPDRPALMRKYGRSGRELDTAIAAVQQKIDSERAKAAENIGTVTFKVPGDGTFTVVNTTERLQAFRKQVESSPGFKDRQPRPALEDAGYGDQRGSGGPKSVIQNMIDEGDPQAAVDYAAARGLNIAEVLAGDKVRLPKVAGLTPTTDDGPVGEFEPEAPTPTQQPAEPATPTPEPEAAQSAAEPAKAGTRLTDAGEELIRNRRGKLKGLAWDDVSAMNDTLKVAQVVKANVWPRQDYAKMVEDGAPAWKAAALKAVYDKLSAAPVTRAAPTDADLRAYIETMQQVREVLSAELDRVAALPDGSELWKTLSARNVFGKVFPVPADARPVYGSPSPFDRVSEQGKENNRRALLIGGNNAVQALQFNYKVLSKVKDLLADGFPAKQESWQKSWEVRSTETRDSDVPETERTGQPQQRFYVYEKGLRWRLAKGGQDGGYATQEQAEAFARSLTAKKREVLPPSRGLDLADAKRTGPDWRNGKDVTADQVMAHFGFRGVNLGEYVKAKQGVAQLHLNHVYDAFSDLADLLGVPPKAMSLNGTLGVAIGAQGSGKALAHFVPGVNEINITRDSGAGALAHEFGHAMDHYFATQHGRAASMAKRPYLSAVAEGISDTGGVRPEVMAAMRAVMKTINSRQMTEAEARKYLADQRELNQRRMDRWVKEFSGNKGADPVALAAAAEKLKRGDLGEVQDTDVETNLAEFMRAAGLKPGNAIAGNAFSLAYRLRDLSDEARFLASHIPQVDTDYAKASAAMDAKKQGDGYWSTPWEKFARAFETFAMDALKDRQRESLYLSGLVDSEGWQSWSAATGKAIPYPAGAERLEMQQAFQKMVDTIQTREDDAGNVAMYSRTMGIQSKASEAFAAMDDLFALPRTDATDVADIAAAIDPEITVTPHLAESLDRYEITMPDGKKASIFVREPSPWGKHTYGNTYDDQNQLIATSTDRPGENRDRVPDETGDVWVDVSKLTSGSGGNKVYAIAGALAHNTGKILIGDPNGVNDTAMRRRPEQMLSLALRYGTTDFLAPHPQQLMGSVKLGIPPLKWSYGDDAANIRALIDLNLKSLDNAGYGDESIRFDLDAGVYRDSGGQELSRADIDALAASGLGRGANAGGRTLARGAVLRAVLREGGRDGAAAGRRNGLLAAVAKLRNDAPQAVEGLFSRGAGTATPEALRQALSAEFGADTVAALESAGLLNIADTPRAGIPSDVAGESDGSSISLYADNTAAGSTAVAYHEAVHAALRQAIGDEAFDALMARVPMLVKANTKWFADAQIPADTPANLRNEELAAYAVQAVQQARESAPSGVQAWVRDFIAALKAGIAKALQAAGVGMKIRVKLMSDAAVLHRLAGDGLKAMARQGDVQPAMAFSRAPDIRYSRASVTTAQDLVNAKGGVFDFNRLGATKQDKIRTVTDGARPFWLGALTRDQIADMYGSEIPSVKDYDSLTRAMENERAKMAGDADELYNEWAKLDSAVNDRLARIMLDATVHQVHPDGAFNPTRENNEERKRVHGMISTQFKLLPKDAQAMYGKVRDFHLGTLTKLRDSLMDRVKRQVENGNARSAALTSIRMQFDKYLENGPYFPLSRFGDFLVVATRAEDGERVVASYETAGEQQGAARKLEADGFTVKLKTAKSYSRQTDGAAGKFISDVLTTVDALDMDDAVLSGSAANLKSQLLDDINQMFIQALPDLSYRRHFMHRKGTPGFSSDVMRGFASSAFHSASHIARLNHGDKMTFALQDAFKAIENQDSGDFNLHTQVLDELAKRHDAAMNPNTHPIASMLNQVGFVMYLGLSPAAGLVNMLQTVMVTMPHLGARYGFGKANGSLATAYADILAAPMNAKNGWNAAQSNKLSTAERRVMSELQDEGVIDLTQAHDLASATSLDTGNVARSKTAFAMSKAMKIVGWTFHIPEVMNRQVTALSAYRLEMEKSGDQDAAKEAAREAIKRTQFDYSSSNRARFMQGNVARVVMQFKQYSQNMTYLLGRAAHQALKGESPEVRSIARRQLVATLGVTFGMAGALGLPGLGGVMGLIGLMVGAMDDDDKPWDWKVEFRNLAADTFGKEAGEVLAHGIPRALMPWDISNRVGMGDLWWRSNSREGQNPREAFASDMQNILGPTAGTVLGMYTAADHMARGNWSKAVESVVPKFLRDPLKGIREGADGVTSYNGEPLLDVTGAEVAGRLLGFAPARASEMYEAKGAVKNAETAINEKRQRLLSQMVKARLDLDSEKIQELQTEISEFNRRNRAFQITMDSILKSTQAKRRNMLETQDGIRLPKGKDDLREIGRFAEVD